MPEINANIVVEPITLTVTDTTQSLDVTVDSTNLNIYTATGVSKPAGNVGELQYHATGNIFGAIANSNVDANGNLVFNNLSNLKIAGGTSAYYLQTDGTGNLTWAAGGTPTGNGVPSGANTQIQLSDGSGGFDSGAGFTFNKASNILSVPGNVVSTGIYDGDGGGLSNIAGANVTGTVANATNATIAGTATYATSAGSATTATSAGSATTAGTVTTAAQPNITSVGTLSSLSVNGNVNITATTSIQQAKEKVTVTATSATGTIDYNILDQAILYYTSNSSNNFVLNVRGNATTTLDTVMSTGESMTFTFINTNAGLPYYLTGIEIDSFSRTINWIDGSAPTTGSPNSLDVYGFNVIKIGANSYTILGSVGAYS